MRARYKANIFFCTTLSDCALYWPDMPHDTTTTTTRRRAKRKCLSQRYFCLGTNWGVSFLFQSYNHPIDSNSNRLSRWINVDTVSKNKNLLESFNIAAVGNVFFFHFWNLSCMQILADIGANSHLSIRTARSMQIYLKRWTRWKICSWLASAQRWIDELVNGKLF